MDRLRVQAAHNDRRGPRLGSRLPDEPGKVSVLRSYHEPKPRPRIRPRARILPPPSPCDVPNLRAPVLSPLPPTENAPPASFLASNIERAKDRSGPPRYWNRQGSGGSVLHSAKSLGSRYFVSGLVLLIVVIATACGGGSSTPTPISTVPLPAAAAPQLATSTPIPTSEVSTAPVPTVSTQGAATATAVPEAVP